MHLLNRYIARTIYASILMVLVVLLGVDIIAAIIDESADLSGNYDFLAALRFVMVSVPGNVFDLLPFATLVGCLAGLGSLAANSELVVMRSAGISTGRVVWMVMRPALIIMLVGMAISEYIAPATQAIAKSERSKALSKTDITISRGGLWHREGNQFMHFNVVQPNGILYGITNYSFDDQRRLKSTFSAERAIYQADHWVIEGVSESIMQARSVDRQQFSSRRWDTELSPYLLSILVLDPMDLSIEGLWQYSSYLQSQGLNAGPYRLAFWKKMLQPLSSVTLVLIAISFIFGPLREVTMGFRIFIGVLVGIVFRTAQDMLAPASLVYGFQPIYSSLVPILVCLIVGLWLLRKAR